MVDYSKLSTEDLKKLKNGDYQGISTEGLWMLKNNRVPTAYDKIQMNSNLTKEQKVAEIKKISAERNKQIEKERWANHAKNFGGAALEIGSFFIPGGAAAKVGGTALKYAPKAAQVASKIAPKIPQAVQKIASATGTGAIQGAMSGTGSGLMNNENPLTSAKQGAGVGATLGAGFPIVGRTIKAVTSPKVVSALTSVPEKYLTRAIEAEKAGNSLFQGQWNPDTAYQGVGRKIREAKGMLPTKEAFAEEFNKQGQKAVQGLENLKNKAGADISEVLEKLGQEEAIDINGLKNALNTNIKSYAKGGDINPALETASRDIEQVQNLLQNETKPIDLHNIKEMLYDKANYETQGGTIRNDVLKCMANQVNNFLRTKVPEYQRPNDVYSMVKDLERGLGGLNQNTVAGKLANYGNVNNTLSGYDTKIKQLNDLLPREQQFLPRVKEIIADQNEINNIQHLIGDNFVRTPRSLEKVYDLERLQALENLQNKTGVNIMDEFNNVRAREALEQPAPGQGGGSGSAQGFINNVLRPAISTTATALGTLGGGFYGGLSSGLISTLLYSPKIMGQGYVKVGGSPFLQKLFASQGQEAPQWLVPLLYGGANE